MWYADITHEDNLILISRKKIKQVSHELIAKKKEESKGKILKSDESPSRHWEIKWFVRLPASARKEKRGVLSERVRVEGGSVHLMAFACFRRISGCLWWVSA
jgi:hypothetical protein